MRKTIALFFLLPSWLFAQQLSIIPQPVSVTTGSGGFVIDKNTSLHFNPSNKDLQVAASYFSSCINHISGFVLKNNNKKINSIEFEIAKTNEIGNEGYLLNVNPTSVIITANTKAGIVYGMQTLFQILSVIRTNAVLKIPIMQIKDYP